MTDDRNNVGTAPVSRLAGDRWAAFDGLPDTVRKSLQERLVNWCELQVAQGVKQLRERGVGEHEIGVMVALRLRKADNLEIARFAKLVWPRQFGRYPHVAADATIMRYHEADHVRWSS